jgi:hypothetical protein
MGEVLIIRGTIQIQYINRIKHVELYNKVAEEMFFASILIVGILYYMGFYSTQKNRHATQTLSNA